MVDRPDHPYRDVGDHQRWHRAVTWAPPGGLDPVTATRFRIGPDDLIDAYVQTVLSIVAIDRCAESLLDGEGELNLLRFRALDDDPSLVAELMPPAAAP